MTVAAGYGAFNALLQLLGPTGPPSVAVSVASAAILLAVVAAIALSLTRLAGNDLFAEAVSPPATGRAEAASADEASLADRKLIDALNRVMTEQKILPRRRA